MNTNNIAGIINKNIYEKFSEHLGSRIYGGIWVGENLTWGSVAEDNGFSTLEFLDFCNIIEAEPFCREQGV